MLDMWLILLLIGGSASAQRNSSSASDEGSCVSEDEIVQQLLREQRVDAKPQGQVKVEVEVWMQTVGPFDGQGSLSLYFYIDQRWRDQRVSWDISRVCGSPKNITLRGESMGKFWRPDLAFLQATEASVLNSPLQNHFLLIYSSGHTLAQRWERVEVSWNQRVHAKTPCSHDWPAFPRDNVTCRLTLSSLSYPERELELRWKDGSIHLMHSLDIPQFSLGPINAFGETVFYPAGHWNELTFEMEFERQEGFFVWSLYAPCGVTLAIALMSFLLSPANITARLLLCLQAVFVLLLLGAHARRGVPALTLADRWIASCFAVAVLAIVLNVVSHLFHVKRPGCFGRCPKTQGSKGEILSSLSQNRGYSLDGAAGSGEASKILSEHKETEVEGPAGGRRCGSSRVDLAGLVLLPLLFALFTAYYFAAL